jgi:nucleoside-diphosphate-sugar epimerase
MASKTLDQCVEGDPAARTVAQVLVHGDPGFQRQRNLFWENAHDRLVATGDRRLANANSGSRSDQRQQGQVAVRAQGEGFAPPAGQRLAGRRLLAASKNGVRALILRAGDFFGPKPANNWFSQGLVKPGKPITVVSYPGQPAVGHQWSYLPDVARAIVELLARRDSLTPFATFHMAGHWDADGSQMVEAIQRVVARRTGGKPRVTAFPWWLLTLASPFVATFREMREMRYLWREPLRMANARLIAALGREPHTPLDEAVEATLVGLGCFAASASSEA